MLISYKDSMTRLTFEISTLTVVYCLKIWSDLISGVSSVALSSMNCWTNSFSSFCKEKLKDFYDRQMIYNDEHHEFIVFGDSIKLKRVNLNTILKGF